MAEVAATTTPTAPATSNAPVESIPKPQVAPTRKRPGDLANLSALDAPSVDLNEPEFDPNAEPEPEPIEASDDALPNEVEADGEDASTQPIFGMEPDALLAELRAGKLPAAMLDQVWAEVPYTDANGNTRNVRMTMNELRKSAMLRSEFTRKTQETAAIRKKAEGTIAQHAQLMEAIKQPQNFRQWVEESGMFESFEAAAQELAREYSAFYKMTPEQQEAYIRQRETDARERKLTAREKAAEEAERARTRDAEQARHRATLERLVPQAFARLKIQDGKLAQKIMGEEILAIANSIPADQWRAQGGITEELVNDAAQATLERLHEMARYQEPAPAPTNGLGQPASRQPQARQGGLPPTALPGGRAPGTAPPKPAGRGKIGDFGSIMAKRNGFR